jgi:hypothetical protein
MLRRLAAFVSVVSVAIGLAGSTGAEEADRRLVGEGPIRGVIELFTSQGCSSCPPADAVLKSYAERRDVIALSYAVDYWDYLGWKDTLALPRNAERQRAYAKARGDGAVYTPQVVVDGQTHVVGSSKEAIDRALEAGWPRFSVAQVPMRVWMQNGALLIQTGAAPQGLDAKDSTIWFAVVQKSVEVPIKRGENASKTITYANVVREITPVGVWTGKPIMIRLALHSLMRAEAEAAVVLIQQGDGGPIVGAYWLGP